MLEASKQGEEMGLITDHSNRDKCFTRAHKAETLHPLSQLKRNNLDERLCNSLNLNILKSG